MRLEQERRISSDLISFDRILLGKIRAHVFDKGARDGRRDFQLFPGQRLLCFRSLSFSKLALKPTNRVGVFQGIGALAIETPKLALAIAARRQC
jgi:hypothetical protein